MMRKPTSDEWAEIAEHFDAIVDLPKDTRSARLDRLRVAPFIAEELRSLLTAEADGGPLDLAIAKDCAGDVPEYASLAAGSMVGPFRIVRLIGRGGMGEVYLAHRDAVNFVQRVALKLLRPEAVARTALFDSERQLLAGLDHPGIARLIDGGMAPDGRPFMALEYVEGEAIVTWCAMCQATLNTRLKLFLELCAAVDHAHARLVLHLDIKPSNILVDGEGRARLLDFGVARLVDFTADDRESTRALLTPDYAAPEQFGQDRLTVATDVYALGAVLFELLAGRGPWQFDGASLPTVVRRLLHDDPPYPSRVAGKEAIAASRLSGDLDAIVMKAMRRNPDNRYTSVAALAADVRSYLALQPIAARSGTIVYRANRFLRRNRWASAAAAVAVLLLLAGVSGIVWQARETAVERDIARAEARKAEAVNNAVSLMFRNARETGASESATARDLLNDSARRVVAAHDATATDTAATVSALVSLYADIGDIMGADALLDAALAKRVGGKDLAATAQLEMDSALMKAASGKVPEARALLERADRVWATDLDRFRKQRVEATSARAQVMRAEGDGDGAIKLLLASLPAAEREYVENPRALLIRYNNLLVHLVQADRLDAAEAVLKRAEAAIVRTRQQGSPLALSLLSLRGGWYSRRDDQASALRTFEQVARRRRADYGPSTALATDLLQLGLILAGSGRVADALPVLTEARAMAIRFSGDVSPPTLRISAALGGVQARLGQIDNARASLGKVEPDLVKQGKTALFYGIFLRDRFELRLAERRFADAARDLDAAERIFDKSGPTAKPFSASIIKLRARLAEATATAPVNARSSR